LLAHFVSTLGGLESSSNAGCFVRNDNVAVSSTRTLRPWTQKDSDCISTRIYFHGQVMVTDLCTERHHFARHYVDIHSSMRFPSHKTPFSPNNSPYGSFQNARFGGRMGWNFTTNQSSTLQLKRHQHTRTDMRQVCVVLLVYPAGGSEGGNSSDCIPIPRTLALIKGF
jgi:hypothetical protein